MTGPMMSGGVFGSGMKGDGGVVGVGGTRGIEGVLVPGSTGDGGGLLP